MIRTLLCSVLLVLGCSSATDPGGATGGTGGDEPARSGAGGATAGSGPAGNSGTGAGGVNAAGTGNGGSGPSKYGQVTYQQFFKPFYQYMTASFADAALGASTTHCDTLTIGVCNASVCDTPPAATVDSPSAGTITFTSTDPAGSASLSPNTSGQYSDPATIQFDGNFTGKEHALFKASGGQVPAFEQAVDFPQLLWLSSPATTSATTPISRSQDLPLQWTRGVKGVSLIVVGSSARLDGQPGVSSLFCTFPSEPGTGTVPSAALQRLEAGTRLKGVTANIVVIDAGGFQVSLGVASDLRNAANTESLDFLLN